ncbi:MAG: PDZ domain-containing protein [Acidobacteria bacterium]|nr:PDZ domain-containing protein [Acidobacteriota bacterium]
MLATEQTQEYFAPGKKSFSLNSFGWFSFSLALLLVCSSIPLQAQKDFRHSLVKVYLDREFSGVVHESRYFPQIHVHEMAELQGVIIDSRGYIVSYVGSYWPELSLPGARVSVTTFDGKEHSARLIGVDERIAVVVLQSADLEGHALAFGPALQESGLRVVSLDGEDWRITSPTVVKVSGHHLLPERELQIVPAGERSGPYTVEGGLVLDEEDRLVAIMKRGHPHLFSKRLQVWRVLPSQVLSTAVKRIIKERKNIRAGWLGIMPDPDVHALRVDKVIPASPAEEAGLQSGDVIVRVDDQPVLSRGDLAQAIRWKGSGNTLDLSVLRDGRLHELSAVLTERQDRGPVVSWRLEVPSLWNQNERPEEQVKIYRIVLPPHLDLGLVVDPLTPQLAKYFKCPTDQGLLIRTVLPDSPASKVGFQAGDVLTQVNGRNVTSHLDIRESLEQDTDGVTVIQFVRNGRLLTRKVAFQ